MAIDKPMVLIEEVHRLVSMGVVTGRRPAVAASERGKFS
jgi:hypothetical protein